MFKTAIVIDAVKKDSKRTISSVNLAAKRAGIDYFVTPRTKSALKAIVKISEDVETGFVHVLRGGDFVMPDFYRATVTTIDSDKADWCFCHDFLLPSKGKARVETKPSSIRQILARRWVLQELVETYKSLDEVYEKLVNEYRGVEIPSVLCGGLDG